MKNLFTFLICLLTSFLSAQDKIPFYDYESLINTINEKSEVKDYDGIIELLDTVNPNDSTYCSLLTTKSYYYIAQEKFSEAIEVVDQALDSKCASQASLYYYMNKGVALSNLEKYNKSIEVYDQGLKRYPANPRLWYNKALIFERLEDWPNAIKTYQKTITLSPLHRNAHLNLGNILYKNGHSAQALMCFNMALLSEPDTDRAFTLLKSLNNLYAERNKNIKNEKLSLSNDSETFEDIDLILDNKIALNDAYESGSEITIALVKQSHALMSQLQDYNGGSDFWANRYVPFYKWIMNNDNFEVFSYTLNYSIKNDNYKKLIEKHKDDVIEFVNAYFSKWMEIMSPQETGILSKVERPFFHYDNKVLQAEGHTKGDVTVGDWVFYDENGALSGRGHYNPKGDREGNWTWFHPNGLKKEIASYTNGELNGENKSWYDNGKKYIETTYKDNKINGSYKYYLNTGALKQNKVFKNGELDGKYLAYFDIGKDLIEFDIDYVNGLAENSFKEYFANGQVYNKSNFAKGEKNGSEVHYFRDGSVSSKTSFKNDLVNGKIENFYRNGIVSDSGNAVDGEYVGPWITYYEDGTIQSQSEYEKGKLNGIHKFFDTDGKLYYEYLYRKGEVIAYKYFDKSGNPIVDRRKKGDDFYFEGYDTFGNKISEGQYNISGGKMGEWKFYYNDGGLSSIGQYIDNMAQGEHIAYFRNGNKSTIAQYKDDMLQDYYQSFFINGQLQSQGYYKDNLEVGEWRYYYADGTLSQINFYHKGQLHGIQKDFTVNGHLNVESDYNYGQISSERHYNQDQKLHETVTYISETPNYIIKNSYANGKTKNEAFYINGKKHGPYKHYDFYGNLLVVGNFVNDALDGKWSWYYPNGKLRAVDNYVSGEKDGQCITYYESGKENDIEFYSYGNPINQWTSFYEDGSIYMTANYSHTLLHGEKAFYGPKGNLQLKRFYDKGTLIGYSYLNSKGVEIEMIPIINETADIKAFYDNGKVSREYQIKNGLVEGQYNTYNYDGSIRNSIEYWGDLRHGLDIEYYEDGSIKEKSNFFYGERNGEYSTYYSDGTLKKIAAYKNGDYDGIVKSYNKLGKLNKTEYYYNGDIYKYE